MAKIKKYQAGGRTKAKPDSVESEMFPGKKIPRPQSNYESGNIAKMLEAGKPKAASSRGFKPSYPTKKDILPKAKPGPSGPTKKDILPNAKPGKSKKVLLKKGGKVMLKRADGSVSQRGLWDNIRANKGSGKKPTAQMLKQEKKIKSKKK
jgi:hypothetical protein